MNSSSPPVRPAAPGTQAPDAGSTTRPEAAKRALSPDTADSAKRLRPAPPPPTTDAQDDDAWQAMAWRTYAYGHDRRPFSPWRPVMLSWGWPIPPEPQEPSCASST